MSFSYRMPEMVTSSPTQSHFTASGAVPVTSRQSRDETASPGTNRVLHSYFDALFTAHGPQHWWPGRSRFEVIVGAILTQNTSWKNVERAIHNLREAKLLSPGAVRKVPSRKLAALLRPSGYFRQKTKTLKAFLEFLFAEYCGSLDRLFATPTAVLREQILGLRGIGPETADSILLYAGKHPVFVVDAYSRRILERHGLVPAELDGSLRRQTRKVYQSLRALFESQLPSDPQLFNEFHALIVHTGKHFCFKSDPACSLCPLARFLPTNAGSRFTNRESQLTHELTTRHSPLATSSQP